MKIYRDQRPPQAAPTSSLCIYIKIMSAGLSVCTVEEASRPWDAQVQSEPLVGKFGQRGQSVEGQKGIFQAYQDYDQKKEANYNIDIYSFG